MIIDIHVHFWESFMSFKCPSIEEVIEGIKRTGIDISYLNSLSGLLKTNPSEDNKKIFKITSQYPQHFQGVAVVNPYAGEEAVLELEKCLKDYKFIGLKLHPWLQGYYASADFLDPILDLCRSYDVPVMFHTGTPPYAQVFEVACQAKKHPKVRFIFCHMGLNYQWHDALETGKQYKNSYFDTSGISYPFAVERIIEEVGAERVMFGTDNPFLFPEIELLKIEDLNLSVSEKEHIFYKTATLVFKQF